MIHNIIGNVPVLGIGGVIQARHSSGVHHDG